MDNRLDALYRNLTLDLLPYLSKPPVEVCGYGPPSEVKQFAANHLWGNLLKKVVSSGALADRAAVQTFLTSNKTCKRWVDPRKSDQINESDHMLLNQFAMEVDTFFNTDYGDDCALNWANICEYGRSGPGQSVGANGTSFYAKHFSSPLTATSTSLFNIYKAYAWLTPLLSSAEIIRQEEYGSAKLVKGSRTSLVPKNADTSRLICVEPTLNMFLQLGVGELIIKRLRRHFRIDLSIQPEVNRYLAKLGSKDNAGSSHENRQNNFCTIDLKSASDSIALGLIGTFLPPEWTSVLLEVRSPSTQLPIDGDTAEIQLDMVSTMGNGFTFPLQTAIFSCIVSACLRHSDIKPTADVDGPANFSVFGDDLIVPRMVYERVCRLLGLLGFVVNVEKSFGSGPFRESCGHDYYHGYNVRPVYIRTFDTIQDFTVILNLLNEWSARTEIPLVRTCEYILSRIPYRHRLYVPLCENVDAGIRIPFTLLAKPVTDENSSFLYRRYEQRPQKVRIGDGTIRVPRGSKKLIYNPCGLMLAFLRGEISNGVISIRSNKTLPYDIRRGLTPNWNYVPIAAMPWYLNTYVAGERLANATYLNLECLIQVE